MGDSIRRASIGRPRRLPRRDPFAGGVETALCAVCGCLLLAGVDDGRCPACDFMTRVARSDPARLPTCRGCCAVLATDEEDAGVCRGCAND